MTFLRLKDKLILEPVIELKWFPNCGYHWVELKNKNQETKINNPVEKYQK